MKSRSREGLAAKGLLPPKGYFLAGEYFSRCFSKLKLSRDKWTIIVRELSCDNFELYWKVSVGL